jgi:hypothetical protein
MVDAGRRIVCATDRTVAFSLCVALGGSGGRACGFGLALVAGRCCGGADVVEAMAGREVVAVGVNCVVDEPVELELEVVVRVVVGVLGGVARATGAGSGPSLGGAFTGARSGPAPRAIAGASSNPNALSTAATSTRANRSR